MILLTLYYLKLQNVFLVFIFVHVVRMKAGLRSKCLHTYYIYLTPDIIELLGA